MKREEQVTVYLEQTELEALRKHADKYGLSISAYLRFAGLRGV